MKTRTAVAFLAFSAIVIVTAALSQTPESNPVQKPPVAGSPAPKAQGITAPAAATGSTSGAHSHRSMAARARQYYALIWGVDEFKVSTMESGELIRFKFRVLDPEKAGPLNDKKIEPFLVDEAAGVKLSIPSLEKVGQLRQTATPEAGKVYWMAFSNKGGYVKPGHPVNVVIGNFHADGLVVE